MVITSKFHKNKYKLQDPYIETDLQGKIGRYIKANRFNHVGETKLVVGGVLNFNKFEPQQLPALWDTYNEGIYYKISDMVRDTKPYDYIAPHGPAYVVCQFWKKRQQEICYWMHIKHVMKIKDSGAKKLTEEDFIKYGFSVNLSQYKTGIKRKKI